MATFADILLEFGRPAEAPPCRALPWETVLEGEGWRFRVSRPAGGSGVFHEISTPEWNAWVVGEIHSYRDTPADAATCVTRFLEDKRGSAESLSGRFLLAVYFRGTGRWSFWTDRCGNIHAYRVDNGSGSSAVGTYSGAVYEHSRRRLDWTGVAGFFRLGFFPENRTYYTDCHVLRPACQYDFSPDGRLTGSSAYWRWTHVPDPRRSEADTIAEFGETLRGATDLQSNHGRIVLPLSGGLDSRTLAACVRNRSDIATFSYGYTDASVESSIASEIAHAAGLTFQSHTVPPYLFDRLGQQMSAVEGFQDMTQTRQAGILDWLGERADFVLGGHWGDVLCDDMKLPPSTGSDAILPHLISKMRKRGGEWLTGNVVSSHLNGADADAAVADCLASELKRFDHIQDADFRVKAVKTAQWAFRWTLPSIRMYQPAAFPRLPFLEPRVIDFFCTVPTAAVRGRRIQVEYLKRFATDLARVRWQSYDADLFHYQHFSTWQLPKRVWKKVVRTLSPQPHVRRNWEVQLLEHRERLEDCLLRPGLFLHDVAPASAVRSLVNEFYARPSAENGYVVSMLLTFSVWAEYFHRKRPL